MPTPTTTGGPRYASSREVAGHNAHQPCSVMFQIEMEALILSPEELAVLFREIASATNGYRTELDLSRNLVGQVQQVKLVLQEFGWSGKSYVKSIGGKNYVVLKGYASKRSVLRGTKYLADNAKVVTYGIGKQSTTFVKGGLVSILFISAINVIETIVREDKDFIDGAAQFATDAVKTVAAAVAGAAAGAALSTVSAPVVLVVGTVIVVGIVAALVLDKIDAKLEITTSLTSWLRRHWEQSKNTWELQTYEFQRQLMWCNSPEGAMACMKRMFGGY